MKTKIQIIDETVKYYSTHERGIKPNGNCEYITPEGNMCAVGRCLLKKELPRIIKTNIGPVSDLYDNYENDPPFKKNYQGHEEYFWSRLQTLHDYKDYWVRNKKGGWDLTEDGKNALAAIKKYYANN